MVTGGAVRSQFEVLEASRQAYVDEDVAGGLAELQGFSAWLGDASIDGDEQDRRARFSVCEEFERRRKETELIRRPGLLIGLQRRASSQFGARGGRQHEGEGEHGVAVATCARRG
jgi:hypothetical protein